MSIIQKTFILSLASIAFAIPQTQWERRQDPATTTTDTCTVGPTSSAVDCLYDFDGLQSSFCSGFVPEVTTTATITTNPTITVYTTVFSSTVFSSTNIVTNASTVTETTTLTQNNTITSGQSTSFIPVQATETITSYAYTCSVTAQAQRVKRQIDPIASASSSCVVYLDMYKNRNGIDAACSCVLPSPTSALTVTETSIVPTGSTVTITSTRKRPGTLTSGVTTSTSISLATITTTSTEIRNATVPNVVPVLTTTGTSYTTTTITTATPVPTSFQLNVTIDGTILTARQVRVNDGTALAFSSTPGGDSFSIDDSDSLVNNNLFLAVITEVSPNDIPFLFWQNRDQAATNNDDILSVNACNGTLTATEANGDVFALCDGLDQNRLLALGPQALFVDNADVCDVVDVGLNPAFVAVPSNSTVTPRAVMAARLRGM